jgi:hypothetical protein
MFRTAESCLEILKACRCCCHWTAPPLCPKSHPLMFWIFFARCPLCHRPYPLHRSLTSPQLQCAFDSCKLPVNDRVSFAGVFQLAEVCTIDSSSLPVVSALCHAWLQRARGNPSLADCVLPAAAAVSQLLPVPISGPAETWCVQPHQNSSGWMATWRLGRALAGALHMCGILCPAPPRREVARAAAPPLPHRFSCRAQGFKFGELSPSNLTFAAFPLPPGCLAGAPLPHSLAEQCATPALSPSESAAHQKMTIKTENVVLDNEILPECPSADVDSKDGVSSSHLESLSYLRASCPSSLHSGMVDSVCRFVSQSSSACFCCLFIPQKHSRRYHCVGVSKVRVLGI